MEKVAVYASFKNKDKKSISYHLKRIKDWCLIKSYDCTIYLDKVKDRRNLQNRKELEDLKDDVRQHRYSKVIIENISQLSNNVTELIEFFDFLTLNNCDIESIDGLDLKLYKKIIEKFNNKEEERER